MMKFYVIIIFTCLFFCGEGKKGFGPGEQDWGYVTVRPAAHMFWWLYYVNPPVTNSTVDVFKRPLLIWLQGGPGASSTGYGNFDEIGPLDLHLQPRNHTWVNDYNVLFIDNPVGTGFSYVDVPSAYARTNLQIGIDLVECIDSFLEDIPQFKTVPTYIIGESYGGKMAVDFAYLWFNLQKAGKIQSNLQGVALGDSWISPIDSVLSWAPFLLHTGMIDTEGYKKIDNAAQMTWKSVQKQQWLEATENWSFTERVIINVAENIDFYNILEETNSLSKLRQYLPGVTSRDAADILLPDLMNEKVKPALNLSATWGRQSRQVFSNLARDFMKPVVTVVEQLLNETSLSVFVFTGQLDLIVATPGTLKWVESLEWKGTNLWKNAPRVSLSVDNIIEGYIKEYRNFKMYWINRSGHMVPRDNPYATKAMLENLTSFTK